MKNYWSREFFELARGLFSFTWMSFTILFLANHIKTIVISAYTNFILPNSIISFVLMLSCVGLLNLFIVNFKIILVTLFDTYVYDGVIITVFQLLIFIIASSMQLRIFNSYTYSLLAFLILTFFDILSMLIFLEDIWE